MKTFYLIDFENVHNEGLKNIGSLSKNDHVHIFSTEKALNIRMDRVLQPEIDIQGHIVPVRKQSVDMHLISYLGYLLGSNGEECSYIIVSKDTDYDNVIMFWKKKGYSNICRKEEVSGNTKQQNQIKITLQTVNSKIRAGMAYDFFGDDKSELNLFMQHGLVERGYPRNNANKICKYVVRHCNDEQILRGIHNDLKNEFEDYFDVYKDVKAILEKFVSLKSKDKKRELQVRSFFGQHFRDKKYVNMKEEIISIILNAQTRQQVNNELLKLYSDGNIVKHIYRTVQPLIKDLPGK